MGEKKSEIQSYLSTMLVMDEYLDYFEYSGIYTQLDKREDQFLFLEKWLNNFYGENSKGKAFDGYTDNDVDDLKEIAFDYLRIRNNYDGKEFRILADGLQPKHFFGNKEIWSSFSKRHEEIISKLPEEPEIDYDSNDIKSHLDDRDSKYFESSKFGTDTSSFLENLDEHRTSIEYNKSAEAPKKLVDQSIRAFSSIKQNHKAFLKPDVQNAVKELAIQVTTSMSNKSPFETSKKHIETLVKSIELENVPDSEYDEVQRTAKEINKLLYPIYK